MVAVCFCIGKHKFVNGDIVDIDSLRRDMLERRRNLRPEVVKRRSAIVVKRLQHLPEVAGATKVAAYLGVRGEIDPAVLLEAEGQDVAVPLTLPDGTLKFVVPECPLEEGPFGIPEPRHGREIDANEFDVVLVPVVVADCVGNRVGHGAGFYDKTFADHPLNHVRGPILIGLCHDFQVVPAIQPKPWDVPLDLIVTEVGLIRPEINRELENMG